MATNLEDYSGVWLKDDDGNKLLERGTTVPTDATSGYAVGCIFIDTDSTTRGAQFYINEGTTTSCDFNPLAPTPVLTSLTVLGAEAGNASLILDADEGDDNADTWTIRSTASGNALDFLNHTSAVASISTAGLLSTTGGVRSSSVTAPIGYTGAGDAETQATSKSTTVVCTTNAVTGDITMDAAALDADTNVAFTLTNTSIAATDVVLVTHISGGTVNAYVVNGVAAAGSATINVRNVTAGSLSEAIVLRYLVLKAAAAA